MAHPHNHSHEPPASKHGRTFALSIALNVVYVAVEAGYGLYINSLALLSDAGHNLSDVLGLLLAWGGHVLAQVRPTRRRSYGWRGATILAALFNALILLAAVGAICWEAIRRFATPTETGGLQIVGVAAVGVVINTITALLFMADRKRDLNIRGAFLHMAADAAVSVGVVIAGLAIFYTGYTWIDPAVSLVVAAVIFFGTWGLLKESVNLAIQAAPEGIDPHEVENYLAGVDGVAEVHDLHIWAMSTTQVAMTAHLVKPQVENEDALLDRIKRELHDSFGIGHATIQIERGGGSACEQSPSDVV